MKGGMVHWSTRIFTSVLGLVTLNTFSSAISCPLRPVACSIAAVSRPALCLSPCRLGEAKGDGRHGGSDGEVSFHDDLLR